MTRTTDLDQFVGDRIRLRRMMLSVSQEKLADSCGITFQQIQKYEKGVNRVSIGRLFQIAKALRVSSIGWFVQGYEPGALSDAKAAAHISAGTLKVAETLASLPPTTRKPLLDLINALS